MDFNVEFYEFPSEDPEQKPKNFGAGYPCCAGKKKRWVVKRSTMKKKTHFDLCPEKQLKDPAFAEKFRKAGKAWDLALQLVSLRKKAGLSQKELAKRVGTSQQQISRLESPSYEGHSLSMLRRVAEVLGAGVRVEIQEKNDPSQWLVAEDRPSYSDKKSHLLKFEINLLRKEKVDHGRHFRIVDALYHEALALGILPLRNPLDGIEVDFKIAKVVNSV
jgi:transcriptional regulator with XRE-family HTH domain